MQNKTSIKNKILIYMIGSATIMAFVLVFMYGVISFSALKDNIDSKNNEILAKLDRILAVPLLNQDYVTIVDLIDGEKKTGNLDYIWITNKDGNIIACSDEEQIMIPIAQKYKNNKHFKKYSMKNGGIISILPNYNIIFDIGKNVIIGSIITFVFLIILLFFLAYRLASKLSIPLKNVVEASAKMADGDFSTTLQSSKLLEIDNMSNSINHTVIKLRELTENLTNEKAMLKHSEKKYRALFDKSMDAFVVIGNNNQFIDCNVAATKLFNCKSVEQLVSMSPVDLSPEYQVDGRFSSEKGPEMIKIALNEGVHFFEWRHRDIDGKEFSASVLLTRMRIDGNEVVQGIIRNITKQKKEEEEIRQTQKMDTVGTLAGGFAHDFNNALSGVIGTLSILKTKMKKNKLSDTVLNEYLDIIERSGQRAADMVKQLLTLSRKEKMALVPVDLNDTIRNIIKICNNSFDKSIKINNFLTEQPAMIEADPGQIEQVLLNLSINASHAMTLMKKKNEIWGGELVISLELIKSGKFFILNHPETKKAKYWMLSVKDNGIGMDKEIVKKIYDPFFTLKGKGVGTGLGLSMSHAIISQHSGFISVYSELGIGSTFNVFLPVFENKKIKKKENEPAEEMLYEGYGLVLVVDDEEVIRTIAKEILEECGYEVILAIDGIDAIKKFEKYHNELKLVLLDMVMPEISGKETYKRMKRINPDVNTLLASGFRQDDRVAEVLELGVKGFIQKPFTFEKLAEKVYKLFN